MVPGWAPRPNRLPCVGVNLLWLVPGVVGGSEGLLTSVLRGVALEPPPDLRLHLFVLEPFLEAHPDLAAAFPHDVLGSDGGSKAARVLAENTWLARRTARAGASLVHHAGGVVPPVRWAPSVLTVHDLQPLELPHNFSLAKRAYLGAMVGRSARAARVVMVPSCFTARTVVEHLGVRPDRVAVVPHGVAAPQAGRVDPESDRVVVARFGVGERYVLYPAITYPHKNHDVLLEAFALVAAKDPSVDLVLTGGAGPHEAAVRERIARPDLAGRVHRLGRVPLEELDVLYRNAAALVFPSRYEGFGLPVLEAARWGCPAVVADAGALPEVVAPGSPVVPVDDVQGWASAVQDLLRDEGRRTALGMAAAEAAASSTVERAAAGLLEVYRRALQEAM